MVHFRHYVVGFFCSIASSRASMYTGVLTIIIYITLAQQYGLSYTRKQSLKKKIRIEFMLLQLKS